MLKAIETKHKGYRFRSRLEARWAVFFDTLGIAWEYEKEGYDLGAVGWYLPDFWLPETNRWIEIKPDTLGEGILHDDYWPTMYAFSEQARVPVIVAIGTPGNEWSYCFQNRHVTGRYEGMPLKMMPFVSLHQRAINDAYTAARAARFEHGERP